MKENAYFSALAYIANEQNEKHPCIVFDEKTYASDDLRPMFEGGYIISLFDFRHDDDIDECLCRISYDKNGFLFQEDYCFGIDAKQDEYLYSNAYNYCIGEEERTEEEFLGYIEQINMLGW